MENKIPRDMFKKFEATTDWILPVEVIIDGRTIKKAGVDGWEKTDSQPLTTHEINSIFSEIEKLTQNETVLGPSYVDFLKAYLIAFPGGNYSTYARNLSPAIIEKDQAIITSYSMTDKSFISDLKKRYLGKRLTEITLRDLERITCKAQWTDEEKAEIAGVTREWYNKQRNKYLGKKTK